MNLLKVMDLLGLVKVQKGREGIMRRIKVRNRVYSPIYGTGTVIGMKRNDYFCVRFDDEKSSVLHDGGDCGFHVEGIPSEWRDSHCRFCKPLKEGQLLEMTDGDTVVKVEGTGVIPYIKKHFLKVVDEDGNLVADHVGVTLINGWPYYVSLNKKLEDLATPKTIYGSPCLFVKERDALAYLGDPVNEEHNMIKKDVRETSFA